MRKNYKLFLWENVLSDWTEGVAFAIARNSEEARDIICKDAECIRDDLQDEPVVITKKFGFHLSGGS